MTAALKNNNLILSVCAGFVLLEMFDLSFVNSIIADISKTFHASNTQIDLVYISMSIGAAMAIPLTTIITNQKNVKWIVFILIALTIPAFILCYYIKILWLFSFLRLIHGFLITLGFTTTYSYSMTHSDNYKKDINLINGVSIIGLLLGPVLSGWLAVFNWQCIFLIFSLLSIGIMVLITYAEFPIKSLGKKVFKKLDVVKEYIILLVLLICLVLSIENAISNHLRIIVVLLLIISLYFLYKHYIQLKISYIFNCQVFNKSLLLALIFNCLVRLILSITPLLSLLLSNCLSSGKIAMLILQASIGSLFAKVLYRKRSNLFSLFFLTTIMSCNMLIMGMIFADKYTNYLVLSILFIIYGFISSILYNLCNNIFYTYQIPEAIDSASLILNMIQSISYGVLVSVLFSIHNTLLIYQVHRFNLFIVITIALLFLFCSNIINRYYGLKL